MPGIGYRHLTLDRRHSEGGERAAGEDGQQVLHSHLLVHANDAQCFVAGPWAYWNLLDDALNVLEPGVEQQWFQNLGDRHVHAKLGEGTVAELWIPVAKETHAVNAAGVTKNNVEAVRPLVVLAVDDDGLVLMNTAMMLEELGHKVFEATSGKQALDILRREEAVDLVITDHAMPQMTGVQLATAIKVERPSLPIILATGYAELPPGSEIGLPKLAKPFRQQELSQAVTAVMGS